MTLVYGAPCAGKTTLVLSRMRPGDVLLDFDRIHRAIDPLAADDTRDLARRIWYAAQRNVADAPADVWLIRVHPDSAREVLRIDWAIEVRAAPVTLRRRVQAGRPPQWAEWLEEWLAEQPQSQWDPDEVVDTDGPDSLSG